MPNGLARNEVLAILKLALDDIERIKQQQWRDSYTILAVQAGLLVLFKQEFLPLRWFFIILSLIAGILGAVLIRKTQHKLEYKFRARKNRALEALRQDFSVLWGGPDLPDELAERNWYPNICLAIVSVGTAFTILVLVKYPPALF
jgi:hypothetical protein